MAFLIAGIAWLKEAQECRTSQKSGPQVAHPQGISSCCPTIMVDGIQHGVAKDSALTPAVQ